VTKQILIVALGTIAFEVLIGWGAIALLAR